MPNKSPLGQTTVYIQTYTPSLLYPIARSLARDKIGLGNTLPFEGEDLWNGYELSWLNSNGKPEIAMAEFFFPCTSSYIVESKSFKLYLNSFNQSSFPSFEQVQKTMEKDLTAACQMPIQVKIYPVSKLPSKALEDFKGICLDEQDVKIDSYSVSPHFLKTSQEMVKEAVYSDLLKSNCLATGQPDWGSLFIHYAGPKIDHEGLLKYIISFRNHSGFAEHCVEQIFHDILNQCIPKQLTVYARYTRRGGLDINPFRSNFEKIHPNRRQTRQ